MQSRKQSLFESIINVSIGYLVAVCSQIVIFPFFGVHLPVHDNFIMGLWFTLVSVIRSYVIRRIFNRSAQPQIPHEKHP